MPVVVKASFAVPSSPSQGGATATENKPIERSVTQAIGERLVPSVEVSVNGTTLPPAILAALRLVEVQQSIRLIDQAVLDFENHGGKIGDQDQFKPGNEIEIKIGYVGEIVWAFKGEIVSIEPTFPVGGNPSVIVRAYDKLHRYRRGRKQRTFLNQKVSEVVQTICGEEGLTADVEDTQTQHEYLLQNNQTNIDYVHELGRRHGYEVEVTDEGKKLFFKKPRYDQPKAHTLKWGDNLKSFHVRKSLANVKTEVTARYWNMKDKAAVSETAKTVHGDLQCKDKAPDEAKKAFGDAKVMITLRPNTAPAEAQAMAWALFNEHALQAVRGRGTCLGEPAIKPGSVLELVGLGKTWSGLYYVTGAKHVLHRQAGYSTEFEVRRTGTGYDEEVVQAQPVQPASREMTSSSSMKGTVERSPAAAAPPPQEAQEEPPAETKHLRLRFVDEDGEAFASCPFELKVGGQTIEGTTTAEGRVIADVPADQTSGEVKIWEDADKSGESFTWPITITDG